MVNINEYQKGRFVSRIIRALFNTVSGKRIAVLGFAFKKDTGDTRETAALSVVEGLVEEGARVAVFDPIVERQTVERDVERVLGRPKEAVEWCESVEEAARGAHALVICTEWDMFRHLPYPRLYELMEKPAHIFDGRLIVDAQELRQIGFHVHAIGKADHECCAVSDGGAALLKQSKSTTIQHHADQYIVDLAN